jgi:hypothetical protein
MISLTHCDTSVHGTRINVDFASLQVLVGSFDQSSALIGAEEMKSDDLNRLPKTNVLCKDASADPWVFKINHSFDGCRLIKVELECHVEPINSQVVKVLNAEICTCTNVVVTLIVFVV